MTCCKMLKTILYENDITLIIIYHFNILWKKKLGNLSDNKIEEKEDSS